MNLLDFTETDFLDFTRCQRPDGSFYGTGGVCRKGTTVGAKEAKSKIGSKAKKLAAKARKELAAEKKAARGKSLPAELKQQLAALKPTNKPVEDEAAALSKRFKESKKELGEGSYGAVKETAEGTVIKQGYIGKNEIAIQQKLSDVDGVPAIVAVAYTSKPFADRGGDRKGIVEMEKASGPSLISQQMKLDHNIKGATATKVTNEYIRLRKELHTRGVAHGDMHEGNVTWNGKKMGVIDFGLSKNSYKAALNEALGSFSTDVRASFFFDGTRRDGANMAKARRLERRVEQIRKKAGSSVTEKRAQQLINELYEGF